MRTLMIPALLAAALAAGDLHAAKSEAHTPMRFTPELFDAQREAILKGLDSDTYRELAAADREEVLKALSRMAQKLEGVTRFEELDKRDQTAVFNDQERINTLLTDAAEGSQVVCKREKFVGSHRTTNVCITVAERRRLAEAAQAQMRGLQRSPPLPVDGTP